MPGPSQLAHPGTVVHLPLATYRVLVRRGRVRIALNGLQQLQRNAIPGPELEQVVLLALMLDCHLGQGDLQPALALADELSSFLDAPGIVGAIAHYSRGELASATEDHELALTHFLAAGAITPDQGAPLIPWHAGAALAMVRTGSRREALDLAYRHHTAARAHGATYDVALALRTLAIVDPDGRRLGRLREARALLLHGDADRLRAQIDTDLAGLLMLSDDTVEAVRLLREAEAFAGRQDLWPLQSRVRRLLDRLGEAPRRVEAEALAVLTAAERRVAVLAIEGLSNRQIAERLRVSVKAVEGHLSKVYRKLNITSRSALSAMIGPPA